MLTDLNGEYMVVDEQEFTVRKVANGYVLRHSERVKTSGRDFDYEYVSKEHVYANLDEVMKGYK